MPRPRASSMKQHPASVFPGMMGEFAGLWSSLAGLMLIWSMLRPYLPVHLLERFAGRFLRRHARRLAVLMDPYLTVTVAEYDGGVERLKRGDVYEQAKAYLSQRCSRRARSLRAERSSKDQRFVLSLGDNEEVEDHFQGATVWWNSVAPSSSSSRRNSGGCCHGGGDVDLGRSYRLVFHERHRDLVVDSYLPHVCREGRAIMVANRRRKLFTNSGDRYRSSSWSHVVLDHPSTFDTLAMDPAKKREIMDDLDAFRKGKEYYARIGKAWKRGYLLYGPPGTGKSTMIAAMANYLDYDIYDVELTSVATNTDLRRMFIETRAKSIIVIEDIDCSLNLTGSRTTTTNKTPDAAVDEPATKKAAKADADDKSASKVTLSGLLNFIDGLWSACGGERIIVFTTNHVEKLDPALIRRGRMDKHIEMSYCCFEAFKFLANNYLAVDAHHPLFDDVKALLQEVNITPADVAELLTPKRADDDADTYLAALVEALQKLKDKASAAPKNEEDKEIVEDE